MAQWLGIKNTDGARSIALACMLVLGACSNTTGSVSEPDWSKDLVTLIPAIDACKSAAPKFKASPGQTITIAQHNSDGTTTVRLGASSLENLGDSSKKVEITHHYWDCTVTEGSHVAKFVALPSGTKRLPGESRPSFTRAEPRVWCFEGECLKQRVFAPSGELLGYLHYRQDAPDSLNSN